MSRKLISAKELAKELNLKLGTIYAATQRGDIKSYSIGRTKRYDINEILEASK